MKAVIFATSLVAVIMASFLPLRSFALTRVLHPRQITAAMLNGETLFRDGHGYRAQHYILYAERNTLHIRKGIGPVEAILVGTPYERLRFASYLAAFQGQAVSLGWAYAVAQRLANVLQFIVFSHSDTSADRDFLRRVSNGRLEIGGDVLAPAGAPEVFGPALDYYQVDGRGRQFRWLGSVTFRFDLSPLHLVAAHHASATFSFTDSDGSVRRYRVDFARYL